jgi:ribosomal protein S18 acetylase RimI-like enzyme
VPTGRPRNRPSRKNPPVQIRGAGWGDAERVVELIGAQGDAALAHLRREWERPDFELGLDNVVAERDDGRLAGYASASPASELALAATDDALADELYRLICNRASERGDKTLAVTVASDEGTLASLVRRHPFTLDHETLTMWRPLEGPVGEPVVPEGVVLRTFEPADARAVHSLLDEAYLAWDTAYLPVAHDGWESVMVGDVEFDPAVWFLAERDRALVGCALHWRGGWLKDIAVGNSERGRGLGATLVQMGLAEFSRRGCARVGLKVDAGNPTGAVRLYERLGFVTTNRQAVWVSTL